MTQYISKKIKIIGFILSIMVVFHHAINYTVYSSLEFSKIGIYWKKIQEILDIFFLIPVPLFFIIAGYLFFRNYSIDKTIDKYKTRFFSLVIPYFIWNCIPFFLFVIVCNIPFLSSHMNKEKVSFSLECFYKLIQGDYNILWFVKNLIIFVIVSPILYILAKKLYIWGGVLLLVFFLNIYHSQQLNEFSLLYTLFYYFLGSGFGIHFKKLEDCIFDKKLCMLSFIGIVILVLIKILYLEIFYVYFRILLLTPLCFFFWIISDFIDFESISNMKLFSLSFFIYCTHSFILESIEKIWLITIGDTLFGSITDFFLVPIITFFILYLFAQLLQKNKLIWNLLVGNRN